ncbi:MAG: type III-B CRISPR module RAMP protein Cmr4 [Victivallales bacterium]|nr:type III-B CRISPR module RAMP protein Cmr4 [Victivallales bacterium]
MKLNNIVTLFARTPLHVGAGNSVGAIDAPIIRERHTNVALIPGSSLKGVLADLWPNEKTGVKMVDGKEVDVLGRGKEAREIFGDDSQDTSCSGELLVGEARVVAFPVRSAKNSFAWIVSPMILQRFYRDFRQEMPNLPKLDEKTCLAPDEVCLDNDKVVLEEYLFTKTGTVNQEIVNTFKALSDEPLWKDTIANRLVIVSDEILSYFIKNACEVTARIRIDDTIGSVAKGALFYQEQLPSEVMLYAILGELGIHTTPPVNAVEKVEAKVRNNGSILQIGGDATIGLGFCSVNFIEL